ncbi:MAG: hypothetical protein ACREVV_04945 [Steroidobacteraceae bacterium]
MAHAQFRSLACISALIAIAAPVYSQQPSATTPASTATPGTPPAAQAPAADKAPSAPSAEMLSRANAVGLRPEVRKGVTVYCRKDADLGTRFPTKKCVDENGLEDMVLRLERQKLQIQQQQGQH